MAACRLGLPATAVMPAWKARHYSVALHSSTVPPKVVLTKERHKEEKKGKKITHTHTHPSRPQEGPLVLIGISVQDTHPASSASASSSMSDASFSSSGKVVNWEPSSSSSAGGTCPTLNRCRQEPKTASLHLTSANSWEIWNRSYPRLVVSLTGVHRVFCWYFHAGTFEEVLSRLLCVASFAPPALGG